MRKLIWLLVFCAGLFCGWWALASYSVANGINAWFDDRRAEGWQADVAHIDRGGFPSTVETRLSDVALADPSTGVAITLPSLELAARTLWPGDLQVSFSNAPIGFASPEGAANLTVDTALADLNLHPGTSLELENVSYTSGPFRLDQPEGGLFAGDGAEMRMAQTEVPSTYDFTLAIGQFAPGSIPRNALLIPTSWPVVFDALQADARIQFDRPWDRLALEDRRPQPRKIDLRNAEAHWGDLRVRLAAQLDIAQGGIPEGTVTLKAENWQSILQLAENAGAIPPDLRQTISNVLTSLASGTGKTNELDVTVRLSGGIMRIGFIPIGPAPRLILR